MQQLARNMLNWVGVGVGCKWKAKDAELGVHPSISRGAGGCLLTLGWMGVPGSWGADFSMAPSAPLKDGTAPVPLFCVSGACSFDPCRACSAET